MASDLVWVGMAAPYANIKYAFRTPNFSVTGAALGQTKLEATTPVQGLIFKANHPKPKKAAKSLAIKTVSSFVSANKEDDARKAGWDIIRARSNGRKGNTSRQVAVYVLISGVKYGWGLPKTRWNNIKGSAAALGIKQLASTDDDVVFGASFPKPPRVSGSVSGGTGKNTTTARISTFYDPSNDPPEGLAIKAGLYEQKDLPVIL
jgi:hypothetical protein